MSKLVPQPTSSEYFTLCELYKRAQKTDQQPSLDELITWLYKRGSIDYTARQRDTLDEIWRVLEEIGPVPVQGNVMVSGFTILRLRVLTQRVPRRKRGAQKKKES